MERRTINGGTVATVLTANISNSAMTISVITTSTFPAPTSSKPSVIVIDRGTADEEKILVISKNPFAFFVGQRGFDGTTAVAHTAGATVDHVLDGVTVQDMNNTVYDTQILNWMGI